eukprot:5612597-Pleurochrysis_carterae.AAC.2
MQLAMYRFGWRDDSNSLTDACTGMAGVANVGCQHPRAAQLGDKCYRCWPMLLPHASVIVPTPNVLI